MSVQSMKLTTAIKYESEFDKTWENLALTVNDSLKTLKEAGFKPNNKGITLTDGYDQRGGYDTMVVSVEGHKVLNG